MVLKCQFSLKETRASWRNDRFWPTAQNVENELETLVTPESEETDHKDPVQRTQEPNQRGSHQQKAKELELQK